MSSYQEGYRLTKTTIDEYGILVQGQNDDFSSTLTDTRLSLTDSTYETTITPGYITITDRSHTGGTETSYTLKYKDIATKTYVDTNVANAKTYADQTIINSLVGYATETWVGQQGYLTSVAWGDITDKPTLSTVATSGSYNDLIDKPTIPTVTSQLTNDSNFITNEALTGYATEAWVGEQGYQKSSDVSTVVSTAISSQTKETWTFTLDNGSTVTKTVVLG